jgi:hypothetical protein
MVTLIPRQLDHSHQVVNRYRQRSPGNNKYLEDVKGSVGKISSVTAQGAAARSPKNSEPGLIPDTSNHSRARVQAT